MTKIDRSGWAPGPWDGEPDRLEWRIGEFGLTILRVAHTGHLKGYLSVPKGHPWWGKDYGAIDANVHGGITYGRAEGERYEFGFDCAHDLDRLPNDRGFAAAGDVYRDIGYVRSELLRLLSAAHTAAPESRIHPVWVWVVDGDRVEVNPLRDDRAVVKGDGATMLRQWVRFGDADIRIAADWIEDHPEFVTGMEPGEVSRAAQRLRSLG